MKLPIFPVTPLPVVQQVTPCQRSSTCSACSLHTSTPAGERCIPADGDIGDILVVGSSPTEFERRLGRPMASPAGLWLRRVFEERYPDRKVVYTNAIGCKLRKDDDDAEEAIAACRPYVAQDLLEADPKVIILLGSVAGESVLGRGFQPLSVRKGYGWFFRDGQARPVFLLQNPSAIMGNRLLQRAFLEDLQAALGASPSPELLRSEYTIVEDPETALQAAEHLAGAPYVATDVETSGMMHEDDFRIECVAVSSGEHTYVWSRRGIENAECREHLLFVLSTLDHTSWNGQYDWAAFACDPLFAGRDAYGRPTSPMRLMSDARIKRKLLEADAKADLATAAELIGMGGHKEEAHTLVDTISTEIHKYHLATKLTPSGKVRKPPQLSYFEPANSPWSAWSKYLDDGFEPVKFAYRFMPLDILHRYCARDALTTWHLEAWANDQIIQDDGLATIWDEVSQKSMWAYCAMRLNGLPLDAGSLRLFQQFLETEMQKVKASIDGYCKGLNPLSPKQVGAYLQSVGIVPHRKTDSGAPSYSDESLEEYKDKHPMVDLILHYRELQKQLGTYAIGFSHYIRKDGRVHPSILSDGTETGRPSASEPNCFTGDTEILTQNRGWVRMDDVGMGDIVAQAIPKNGWAAIEWTQPTGIVQKDFHGELVHLHNGHIDLLVTPDHRCPTRNRKDRIFREYTALTYPKDAHQLNAGSLVSPGIEVDRNWITLLCATQADGHFNGSGVAFCFRKKRKYDRLVAALTSLGATFSHREPMLSEKTYRVYIKHSPYQAQLYTLLGKDKVFGPWLLAWDHASLRALTEEVPFWDGDAAKGNYYASTDRRNMDYVQAAYSLVGKRAFLGSYPYSYDKEKTIHVMGAKNVDYSMTTNVKRERIHHDGKVYCVSVPSSYILVRRNGKTMITGNCLNVSKGRTERKKQLADMLRASFICPPGWSFIEVDSGQIEIRGAAHLSGDQAMHEMLTSGTDFHMASAKRFASAQGKDPEAVTDLDREQAKTSNFAAVYEIPCQLGFMLSSRIGVEKKVGQQIADAMFQSYTGLRVWMDTKYAEAWKTGIARTQWKGKPARKRPLWGMGKNPPTLKELEAALVADRGRGSAKSLYDLNAARSTYNGPNQGCYPAYMKVLTRDGYVPIGDAPIQGEVWNGHAWCRYTRLDMGSARIAHVRLQNGHLHTCDIRHKFLVQRADSYEFVHFPDLKVGDKVCLSLADELEFGESVVSEETAYWMGFSVGNGCTRSRKNALVVTFGDRKGRYEREAHASKYSAYMRRCGFKTGIRRSHKRCVSVRVEHGALSGFWKSLGYPWGCKARDKYVPDFVWRASLPIRKAFLLGLLDADGHVGGSDAAMPNLHMCAGRLLQEVQVILRTVGVESSYRDNKDSSVTLTLNGCQAARHLGYGVTTKLVHKMPAPPFAIQQFLSAFPKWPPSDRSGYTLHCRMKSGGSTGVYQLLDMAGSRAPQLYSYSEVTEITVTDAEEQTWTLSVHDESHRFDCCGVIAKNSAVDVIASHLWETHQWLAANTDGGQLILQVYDSIMVMVRDEDVDKTLEFLLNVMVVPLFGNTPLTADAKVGKTWGSMKKIKLTK